MRRIIAALLLFSVLSLSAQEKKEEKYIPDPYEIDEFHPVLHDIRRSTIIFSGAFPLGYMYSTMLADSALSSTDFYTDKDEQEKVEFKLLTALSFAGFIMLIDFIIEKIIKGRN